MTHSAQPMQVSTTSRPISQGFRKHFYLNYREHNKTLPITPYLVAPCLRISQYSSVLRITTLPTFLITASKSTSRDPILHETRLQSAEFRLIAATMVGMHSQGCFPPHRNQVRIFRRPASSTNAHPVTSNSRPGGSGATITL